MAVGIVGLLLILNLFIVFMKTDTHYTNKNYSKKMRNTYEDLTPKSG